MSTIIEQFELLLENPTPPNRFEFKSFLRSQPIGSVLESSETIMVHEDSVDYLNEIYKTGTLTVEQMKVEVNKINNVLSELSQLETRAIAPVVNKLRQGESFLKDTIVLKESDEYLLESAINYFETKEERYKKQLTNIVVTESFKTDGPDKLFFNTLEASLEAEFGKELFSLAKIDSPQALTESISRIGKIVSKYDTVYEDSLVYEAGGVKEKAKKTAIKADEKSRDLINKARKGANETKRVAVIAGKAGGRVGNLVTKTLEDIKTMDRQARMQAIATGGMHKRLFKVLRTVVTTGAIAYFSPIAAAIHLVVTVALNERTEKRLKDALITDLEHELRVVQEKVRDADSNGDKKAKYQLMRLESKLEKEIMRIKTGNKNIEPMNYKELRKKK